MLSHNFHGSGVWVQLHLVLCLGFYKATVLLLSRLYSVLLEFRLIQQTKLVLENSVHKNQQPPMANSFRLPLLWGLLQHNASSKTFLPEEIFLYHRRRIFAKVQISSNPSSGQLLCCLDTADILSLTSSGARLRVWGLRVGHAIIALVVANPCFCYSFILKSFLYSLGTNFHCFSALLQLIMISIKFSLFKLLCGFYLLFGF